jgi:hypothetical protein
VELVRADERDAEGAGEPGVLPVRAVPCAVRQQDDVRVARVRRGRGDRRAQRLAEQRDRAVDGLDTCEHLLRQRRGQRGPRRHGEGDPARRPQVVLQHREHAVVPAHDVEAGHADPAPPRRPQPGQLGLVVLRPAEHAPGHDAVGDDALRPVDVGHERVERPHALLEPAREDRPLVRVDHARHRVDGELALAAGRVEGHAGRARLLVHERPQRAEVVRADGLQRGPGDGPDLAARVEGLVPRRGRVCGERGGRHLG